MGSDRSGPPASHDRPTSDQESTVEPHPQIDLTSEPTPPARPVSRSAALPTVGIHFTCCHVYAHLRPPADRTRWWAHCPRCGARLAIELDPEGPEDHFVQVG